MFDNISLMIWIIGPVVGLFGMFAGGYWGVGCGWLVVPVMLLMGLTPMEAVGIALLQMAPSILPTVVKTAKEISWKPHGLGRAVLIPMAAGAIIASFSGQPINQVMYRAFGSSGLMVLFAVVNAFIGLQTACSRAKTDSVGTTVFTWRSTVWGWAAGLATGVFSSVLGVGGAILMRPILASGYKVSEHDTSVSIRILLLVTTLMGGVSYLVENGVFQWRILILTFLISLGGMIGFPLGVKLHNIVAKNGYTQHIHKSFACISVIVVSSTALKLAGKLLWSQYLMIVCALLLLTYLLSFGFYTMRHPRTN